MEKNALVTGADRGLGFSLTHWLLENGYKVFAGRYNEDWTLLDDLKVKYPDMLELVTLDVGNDKSVEDAARFIQTKTSYLDIIINNAGIIDQAKNATILEEQDFEVMQQLFNINSLGALRVSNQFIDLLLKGDTKLVVNISSEAGSIARNQRTNWYGYCMSKAALNMQSSILHKHLTSLGGQVLVFHPGWMQTYMEGFHYKEATYPPEIAAEKIMKLVHDHKRFLAEEPAYIDLEGQVWPW
ncbi:SDR family NAD(P)-dependent oxidoreductase [Lederbergia wuyishanensis]|uniref:NAD(P)-dependent dehydrogenase (Short-subunit alcohol dehydrogenase family) n=1 Tax=Lederbergia wuyishanensis TaxID=1347903 RepID=A0ABU0CYI7_9BACI|nr:SDR family NAD(P)-dependent oxidoreductase [Lederbergia wuyishanensis]MCJ8005843.1 SDR family NAD(P)-dependent oxidoreductase [Lederbergia wuyishanensis]MDQ0341208.1 NAD(P)-dependent dehydrogenase (short-subunit alcohol dehydrogenase family) [Lederbergia wuyishanensis]